MYERILVPLDGSETAEAALAYVQLLPSHQVRLLAVESDRADLSAICKAARDCQTYLEAVAEPLREQGRNVETIVVFGNPAEQILAFAATADLVVMGSHGHGGVERFVLGSVADQVARHAPVPTMIVRVGPGQRRRCGSRASSFPLDGSTLAEQALPVAASLAADLGIPSTWCACSTSMPCGRRSRPASMRRRRTCAHRRPSSTHAEEYLAERAQELRNQDCAATSEVLLGSPAVDAARRDSARRPGGDDHPRAGRRPRWLLGSVADKLVRAAAAPILLVPPSGPEPAAPGEEISGSPGGSS